MMILKNKLIEWKKQKKIKRKIIKDKLKTFIYPFKLKSYPEQKGKNILL